MKFTKAAVLVLSLSMVGMGVCACSNEPEPVSSDVNVISTQNQNTNNSAPSASIDANAESENFVFVFSGAKLIVNTAMNEDDFNEDDYEYFESASCAGQGLSKIYTFKGGSFTVSTNPVGDEDSISSIALFDDTVATAEGIYIGQTVDDVKSAYGEPDTATEKTLTYIKGSSELEFVVDDNNVVTNIIYNAKI